VRKDVATLGEDRYLAPDLERATRMIASGDIVTAAAIDMPEFDA
jgi:histidine ammonia-lyase